MNRSLLLLLAAICVLAACGPQSAPPPGSSLTASPAARASSSVAQPTPARAPTASSVGKARLTAREAWQLVAPEVGKWQQGAKIAIAAVPTSSKDFDLFDGRSSAWYFICASPDEQQFHRFTVDTSGEQPKVRSGEVQNRPSVTAMTDPASWQVDSPRAYEIAMANGLKEWLGEHPSFQGKDATLELAGLKEIGPYWLVICHHDKATIEFRISATDGKVHHARSH